MDKHELNWMKGISDREEAQAKRIHELEDFLRYVREQTDKHGNKKITNEITGFLNDDWEEA